MTDVSAEKFNIICRLCTSSLVDDEDGAHEIFGDNVDTPKSIHKKITICLQLKVLMFYFIGIPRSYNSKKVIIFAPSSCHYHAYRI